MLYGSYAHMRVDMHVVYALWMLCVQLMEYKVKWSESQTELQQQLKGAKKVTQALTNTRICR